MAPTDRSQRGSQRSVASSRFHDIVSQLPSRRADAFAFTEAALHGNRSQLTASLIENYIRDTEEGSIDQSSNFSPVDRATRSRNASRARFSTVRYSTATNTRTSVVANSEASEEKEGKKERKKEKRKELRVFLFIVCHAL